MPSPDLLDGGEQPLTQRAEFSLRGRVNTGKKSHSGRELTLPTARKYLWIKYLPIRLSSFRQRLAGKFFSLPAPQQGSARESGGTAARPCSAGADCARSSRWHTLPASRDSYASIAAPGWRSLDLRGLRSRRSRPHAPPSETAPCRLADLQLRHDGSPGCASHRPGRYICTEFLLADAEESIREGPGSYP